MSPRSHTERIRKRSFRERTPRRRKRSTQETPSSSNQRSRQPDLPGHSKPKVNAATGPSVPREKRDRVRAAIHHLGQCPVELERRAIESIRGRVNHVSRCNADSGARLARLLERTLGSRAGAHERPTMDAHTSPPARLSGAVTRAAPGKQTMMSPSPGNRTTTPPDAPQHVVHV